MLLLFSFLFLLWLLSLSLLLLHSPKSYSLGLSVDFSHSKPPFMRTKRIHEAKPVARGRSTGRVDLSLWAAEVQRGHAGDVVTLGKKWEDAPSHYLPLSPSIYASLNCSVHPPHLEVVGTNLTKLDMARCWMITKVQWVWLLLHPKQPHSNISPLTLFWLICLWERDL